MRYQLMFPPHGVPPVADYKTIEDFVESMHGISEETDLESDAIARVRARWADAYAVVIPRAIGSGDIWVLGILESPHAELSVGSQPHPFKAVIMAKAENASDKKSISKRSHFSREMWKLPVEHVRGPATNIEIRRAGLVAPVRAVATIGTVGVKPVLTFEIGGVPMSIRFDDEDFIEALRSVIGGS